jgi:hypothetical protein
LDFRCRFEIGEWHLEVEGNMDATAMMDDSVDAETGEGKVALTHEITLYNIAAAIRINSYGFIEIEMLSDLNIVCKLDLTKKKTLSLSSLN